MTILEVADEITVRATQAGLDVSRDGSSISESIYLTIRRHDRQFFDVLLGKSRRREFCSETGFSFPRYLDGFKVRVSDHAEVDGSATHGASHANIVVTRGNVDVTMERLSLALKMLAA